MPLTHPIPAALTGELPLALIELPPDLSVADGLALFDQRLASNGAALLATTTDLDRPGPTITFVNRAFTELTGYAAEEVVGKSPRVFAVPRHHPERHQRAEATRRPPAAERRRVEEESRERAEMLRGLGDNLPGGGLFQFVREPGGREFYQYVSAGVEHLTGMPAADLLAGRGRLFDLLDPPECGRAEAAERRSAADLTVFDVKVAGRSRDGKERVWHFRSGPRRTADGGGVWDGVILDVTEQHQLGD